MKVRGKELHDIGLAALCIGGGTVAGILSYAFCLAIHLDIFGWNLGLAISPLVAGYVETQISIRYLNETTGAISAYILFFITVIYGFIISNPTLGLNGITIGSFFIIIQAAFPTLINYFLIVVVLGVLSYIFGFFKKTTDAIYYSTKRWYCNLTGKEFIIEVKEDDLIVFEEIDINDLGILLLSTTHPWGKEVESYEGIFEGRVVIPNDEKFVSKNNEKLLKNLDNAKDKAISNLAKAIKANGGNGVLDLTIEYDSVGDLKEKSFQIIARGTGVVLVDPKASTTSDLIKKEPE